MNDDDVAKLLKEQGLVAVDPFALMAFNAVEPDFADSHPCFTHWKVSGEWYYASFSDWSGEREVAVRQRFSIWDDRFWVAGVRKPLKLATCS